MDETRDDSPHARINLQSGDAMKTMLSSLNSSYPQAPYSESYGQGMGSRFVAFSKKNIQKLPKIELKKCCVDVQIMAAMC